MIMAVCVTLYCFAFNWNIEHFISKYVDYGILQGSSIRMKTLVSAPIF